MPAPDPSTADLFGNLGILLAAAVAALAGYFGPKVFGKAAGPPAALKTDAVVAGVGVELGTRLQVDQLVVALNRIADVLENKRQADMDAIIKRMAEELDEMREEQRWRGQG